MDRKATTEYWAKKGLLIPDGAIACEYPVIYLFNVVQGAWVLYAR